jgi:hypothetical protein
VRIDRKPIYCYCEQPTERESHWGHEATSKLCEGTSDHVAAKKQKDSESIVGRIRPLVGEGNGWCLRIELPSGKILVEKWVRRHDWPDMSQERKRRGIVELLCDSDHVRVRSKKEKKQFHKLKSFVVEK